MTSTANSVSMEPQSGGMRHENSAVEAIGRLEELTRGLGGEKWRARGQEVLLDHDGDIVVIMAEADPRASFEDEHAETVAAYIAAANPQAILSLIESLRHSVEREAGLREALEAFVAYDAHNDGDGVGMMLAYDTAITKARAALDRRAGDA